MALSAPLLRAAQPVRLDQSMRVTFDSLGPVRLNMTVRQVSQVLRDHMRVSDFDAGCGYLEPVNGAVAFMLHNHRVVRIDVVAPGWLTTEGIGIGAPIDDVRKAYGSRLRASPSGSLVVDSRKHSLLFETDGTVVTSFRSGLTDAVARSHGCS